MSSGVINQPSVPAVSGRLHQPFLHLLSKGNLTSLPADLFSTISTSEREALYEIHQLMRAIGNHLGDSEFRGEGGQRRIKKVLDGIWEGMEKVKGEKDVREVIVKAVGEWRIVEREGREKRKEKERVKEERKKEKGKGKEIKEQQENDDDDDKTERGFVAVGCGGNSFKARVEKGMRSGK